MCLAPVELCECRQARRVLARLDQPQHASHDAREPPAVEVGVDEPPSARRRSRRPRRANSVERFATSRRSFRDRSANERPRSSASASTAIAQPSWSSPTTSASGTSASVEENLGELPASDQRPQRADAHSRLGHVDDDEADALVLGPLAVGAHQRHRRSRRGGQTKSRPSGRSRRGGRRRKRPASGGWRGRTQRSAPRRPDTRSSSGRASARGDGDAGHPCRSA